MAGDVDSEGNRKEGRGKTGIEEKEESGRRKRRTRRDETRRDEEEEVEKGVGNTVCMKDKMMRC